MLIPLQTLIEQIGEDRDLLEEILSSFSCELDADIQSFLHTKAVEFENISKARTYFLCDPDKMEKGEFVILGYFALSLKVLILPDDMSVRARKEIDGYRGKIHGIPIREVPCFLIGQLAKNSKYDIFSSPRIGNQATHIEKLDSCVQNVVVAGCIEALNVRALRAKRCKMF